MDPRRLAFVLALAWLTWSDPALALTVPTNFGIGADAEVRESNPTQNRGASTELATRVRDSYAAGDVNDGSDRNSVMYLQFDLSAWASGQVSGAVVRLTVRNNNLTDIRLEDLDGLPPDFGRNGLAYYGMYGAWFDESLIDYTTAPGLVPDGDIGTDDFAGSALHLGFLDLPLIGTQNHLPVGSAIDFSSAWLDAFLNVEMATNPSGVAVIAVVHRNQGLTDTDPSSPKLGFEPVEWANFNYLFNSKEQTTLSPDTTYEADIDDPTGLGSPWSNADNSMGEFSPQLLLPGVGVDEAPINIDFSAVYPTPNTSYGGAAGTPGLWNRVLLGTSLLSDVNGQPAAATIVLAADIDTGAAGVPTDNASALLNDNFRSTNLPWTADVSGLAPGFYEVFLYAPSAVSVGTGDVDANGVLVPDIPGDPASTLIDGTSFTSVVVEVQPAGVLSLSADCIGACGLAGMQISYLPEPSLGAGLMAGALLQLVLARVRSRAA